MPKIFTPVNQLRLTDVSIVRLKKGGKRFEIACHKNKVMDWRNNIETDIDDVLQIHTVFINVSKGQAAKKDELINAFGNCDVTAICKDILAKGELQVSEKERNNVIEMQLKEVIDEIAQVCINTTTNTVLPVNMIENTLRENNFKIKSQKTKEERILEGMQVLRDGGIPLERAVLTISVTYRKKEATSNLRESISKLSKNIVSEQWQNDQMILKLQIDPGNLEVLQNTVRTDTRGKCELQVLEVTKIIS